MQGVLDFLVNYPRCSSGFTFQRSIKQIFLVFLMVSLSRAFQWENEANISTVCDSSTMYISVNFTHVFQGVVYQERNYFDPICCYAAPIDLNTTQVQLSMPLRSCDIKIEEKENETIASTKIFFQLHSILDSIFDKSTMVSCVVDNFQIGNETESDSYNPFAAYGLDTTWIEFKNGLSLFGEVNEMLDAALFFVVNVRDDGSNRDMMVQNCIAHTDKNITDRTTLVQLSNFYGCPDPLAILPDFKVMRQQDSQATILAYAPISNFSLIASGGRVFVTCGITICENACPNNCNDTQSPFRLPLSDYATKVVVSRREGAVMPLSLRELNRHNDRSRRTPNRPKRSLSSFFSSIMRWESVIVSGPVSKGNVTYENSTGIVKNSVFGKSMHGFAKKPHVSDVTNVDSDEFCMDWKTFRFIALMTICLFITVVACYCCYADVKKPKNGQSPFVF